VDYIGVANSSVVCSFPELQSGSSAMWHHVQSLKQNTKNEFYGSRDSHVDFNIGVSLNLNDSGHFLHK
jgi:hypothetical protein